MSATKEDGISIKFLDGPTLGSELPRLCRESQREIRMAVAFWGDGALEALALTAPLERVRIVCNLTSGGTNPRVIRQLLEAKADVRHADDLHAKLYLFDDWAVVGSSNVSANGLSLQGPEAFGWTEASILFDQSCGPYADAQNQFKGIWSGARSVTEADLKAAEVAWSRRRRAGLFLERSTAPTLLAALRAEPALFADQRIYLSVDVSHYSLEAQETLAERQADTGLGKALDGWEGWDTMPDDATFVCFWRGPRGKVEFHGFWYSPAMREETLLSNGLRFQFIRRLQDIKGARQVGETRYWRPVIEQLVGNEGDGGMAFIELGRLAREYLAS